MATAWRGRGHYLGAIVRGGLVGARVFRLNFLSLLGATAGGMTSTPGLAGVASISDPDAPAVAYAAVYPVAMVAMILACQIVGRL